MSFFPVFILLLVVALFWCCAKHITQSRKIKDRDKQVTLAYRQTFRDVFDGMTIKGCVKLPEGKNSDPGGFVTSINSLIHKT